MNTPGRDEASMKKDLREAVNVLTEYVMAARNEFNQVSGWHKSDSLSIS